MLWTFFLLFFVKHNLQYFKQNNKHFQTIYIIKTITSTLLKLNKN